MFSVIGQPTVTEYFENKIADINTRVGAYILYGPSGSGKTTTANEAIEMFTQRFIANGIINNEREVVKEVINTPHFNGVDNIRVWNETLKARTFHKVHFYIFDEAHRMTKQGWETMLTTLEQLPDYTFIFFCTTEITSIPETVLSRLTKLKFSRVTRDDLAKIILLYCQKYNVDIESYTVDQIISYCNGNVREAKNIINILISKHPYHGRPDGKIILDKYSFDREFPISDLSTYCYGVLEALRGQDMTILTGVMNDIVLKFQSVRDFFKAYNNVLIKTISNKYCVSYCSDGDDIYFDPGFINDQLVKLIRKQMIVADDNWELLLSLFYLDQCGRGNY